MPATVIAERIGWTAVDHGAARTGSRSCGRCICRRIRRRGRRYEAGEIAQCDLWFPDIELPVGFGQTRTAKQLPVLVMVAGYSRWLSAVLIPIAAARRICSPGWWQLLVGLGAVPRVLVWDGEGAVGRWRARAAEADRGRVRRSAATLGAEVHRLPARRPGGQGAGRAGQRLPGDLVPARPHASPSPADFNTQLASLAGAGERAGSAGCWAARRRTGSDADRAAMLALPPVAPATGWRHSTRLPRDHYVRLDGNDYSVHPAVIGRRVEVVADLDRVRVLCDGAVGRRPRPGAGPGIRRITDPEHVAAAQAAAPRPDRRWSAPAPRPRSSIRGLADYDRAFGLDGEEVA